MLTVRGNPVDKILYWESSIGLCRCRIKIYVKFSILSINYVRPKIRVCWYVLPFRLANICDFGMAHIDFLFRVKRYKNIS
jgi:hypothetical protein